MNYLPLCPSLHGYLFITFLHVPQDEKKDSHFFKIILFSKSQNHCYSVGLLTTTCLQLRFTTNRQRPALSPAAPARIPIWLLFSLEPQEDFPSLCFHFLICKSEDGNSAYLTGLSGDETNMLKMFRLL